MINRTASANGRRTVAAFQFDVNYFKELKDTKVFSKNS